MLESLYDFLEGEFNEDDGEAFFDPEDAEEQHSRHHGHGGFSCPLCEYQSHQMAALQAHALARHDVLGAMALPEHSMTRKAIFRQPPECDPEEVLRQLRIQAKLKVSIVRARCWRLLEALHCKDIRRRPPWMRNGEDDDVDYDPEAALVAVHEAVEHQLHFMSPASVEAWSMLEARLREFGGDANDYLHAHACVALGEALGGGRECVLHLRWPALAALMDAATGLNWGARFAEHKREAAERDDRIPPPAPEVPAPALFALLQPVLARMPGSRQGLEEAAALRQELGVLMGERDAAREQLAQLSGMEGNEERQVQALQQELGAARAQLAEVSGIMAAAEQRKLQVEQGLQALMQQVQALMV